MTQDTRKQLVSAVIMVVANVTTAVTIHALTRPRKRKKKRKLPATGE